MIAAGSKSSIDLKLEVDRQLAASFFRVLFPPPKPPPPKIYFSKGGSHPLP